MRAESLFRSAGQDAAVPAVGTAPVVEPKVEELPCLDGVAALLRDRSPAGVQGVVAFVEAFRGEAVGAWCCQRLEFLQARALADAGVLVQALLKAPTLDDLVERLERAADEAQYGEFVMGSLFD